MLDESGDMHMSACVCRACVSVLAEHFVLISLSFFPLKIHLIKPTSSCGKFVVSFFSKITARKRTHTDQQIGTKKNNAGRWLCAPFAHIRQQFACNNIYPEQFTDYAGKYKGAHPLRLRQRVCIAGPMNTLYRRQRRRPYSRVHIPVHNAQHRG